MGLTHGRGQRRDDGRGVVFARQPHQQHEARLAFDERRDVGVTASRQQVAFPVARDRAVGDLRRPICRSDSPRASPREISSRSGTHNARRDRVRRGGGIPPRAATTE